MIDLELTSESTLTRVRFACFGGQHFWLMEGHSAQSFPFSFKVAVSRQFRSTTQHQPDWIVKLLWRSSLVV